MLDYAPVYDTGDLMQQIYSAYPQYRDDIQIAYEFASRAHAWVLRQSWEPYIVHVVRATVHLLTVKPDLATIQACLLHDVLEDTQISAWEIQQIFGDDVAILCQAMVKVWKVKYRGEERSLEIRKKTLLAMANDIRVLFIKLADRTHNIQSLSYHTNPEKVHRIARETLDLYSSIAKRLWLSYFHVILENWAYKYLEPQKFDYVMEHMLAFYHETYVQQWCQSIKVLFEKEWVNAIDIKWRLKSPYRVAVKMFDEEKPYDFFDLHDILAFRVIVPDIAQCYLALWAVHSAYTPFASKIKDYIASPRSNWYQSLHTSVLWMYDFTVEVQIRTPAMDEIAEYGVAAHFAYAESWSKAIQVDAMQSQRVQRLKEMVGAYQDDSIWFKNQLSTELIEWYIYIYTPKWDVIELPRGATILDFAFRVHTKVWLSFRSWLVNGSIVPLDYELHTGDRVQIQTRSNKISCNPWWIKLVVTSWAKQSINKYLKSLEKDRLLAGAKQMIIDKLAEFNLPSLWSKEDKLTIDDIILLKIYDKQLWVVSLLKSVYHNFDTTLTRAKTIPWLHIPRIYIDNSHLLTYTLCPECKPNVSHLIIARSGTDWFKIHTLDCKALDSVNFDNLMEAHRDEQDSTLYSVKFTFCVVQKSKMLIKILTIFAHLWVNITSVDFPSQASSLVTWYIVAEFAIPSKIAFVIKHLKVLEPHITITHKSFV